ncbi:Protodermal factor 1 [Striga hermonthica]|uniref:Protodermal factor 1 n=1 Tax=Striga hermonthica TaxID=68872 RepID=A0A9N7R1K4_STRHE|nr:Protodermal factor 1 [Striga hermonthica]
MEANRSWRVVPLLLWAAMVAMFSHNLVVVPVMSAASFDDQKNYYPPDPNTPTPTGLCFFDTSESPDLRSTTRFWRRQPPDPNPIPRQHSTLSRQHSTLSRRHSTLPRYWLNHPTLIWGLFGFWGTTIGTAFGSSSLPGFGANTNIIQALSNTRTDGLGQLYREGTAALLNSMAHARFPYTTSQVRDSFLAAVGSNQAAAAQAQLFRMANEGRTKPTT